MERVGLDVDEAALLKAYGLDTLEPTKFHEAQHDDDGAGDSMTAQGMSTSDEPDPLGLHPRITTRQWPKELRAQISVSSKAFDPKAFLSTVHPDATFADLNYGMQHLRSNIEQRSQALKVLVEDNFDRFVAVKATTDGVYREMRETERGPLRPDAEYGVKELKAILAQASARADQVFTPVLENNLKATKLRPTLGVFERSKFFFNLPGSLAESLDRGRYDAALRDYNRCRFLLENRPGQLLAFNTPGGQAGDADAKSTERQRQQQERVFRKVWDAVEATMKDMERKLMAALREPKRNIDDQEKTIEILLELCPKQDPVGVFLESQHRHIHSLMRSSLEVSTAKVTSTRTVNDLLPRTEKDRARDIQSCLRQIAKGDPNFERNVGAPTWRSIHELVRTLSSNVAQHLPSFWRVCKSQTEGRSTAATKLTGSSRAQSWASDSIETYIGHLSSFFNLTDVGVLGRQPLSPLPAWVPSNSNSMTAAHYIHLMLQDLTEACDTLSALAVGQTPSMLRNFVLNARFAFTEVLCNLWQADSKLFFMLEDWTINPDEQSTTLFLQDLTAFHRSNSRAAYHIASGRGEDTFEATAKAKGASGGTGVSAELTQRVKASFLDSIYAFLDGLVHLAFSEYDPLDPTVSTSHKVVGHSRLTVDVQELDTRILLAVTNLAHLNRIAIPTMAKQFQEFFRCKMSEDLATVDEVASQLDKILFEDFLKRKIEAVSAVFSNGILLSGVDWRGMPSPGDVHPYIYEALLALVQVHAQVQSVAKSLINRTISALLESLTLVVLDAFRRVPSFGMGGMLQATLEIEFVHQTLGAFVSPKAEATLKEIYETISSKYTGSSAGQGEADKVKMQRELEQVKKTLMSSRRTTALEFLCFRKKLSSASSSSRSNQGAVPMASSTSASSRRHRQ